MLFYIIKYPLVHSLRELSSADYKLIRAARSFAYNYQFLPVIAGRLERAEDTIRTYLLMHGLAEHSIGPVNVSIDSVDGVSVSFSTLDGWEQLSIPVGEFIEEVSDG